MLGGFALEDMAIGAITPASANPPAMVLARSFDADRLNALANDPAIRPHVGGDLSQALDLTAAVADRANQWLLGEHGGFGYVWSGPATYEVHTMILPAGRGRWAYAAARASLAAMAHAGASMIWTRIAPDAGHVGAFARSAGFVPAGHHTVDLGAGPITFSIMKWTPACR